MAACAGSSSSRSPGPRASTSPVRSRSSWPPSGRAARSGTPPRSSPRGGPVRTMSGLGLVADAAIADVRGPIDTFFVAGGDEAGIGRRSRRRRAPREVRRLAAASRRVASVCSGAFVLAAAGLLDGRRATTHWSACDELAAAFPAVTVERDPIFVRDGKYATSAGVTAGIDLALALVEEDHGHTVAMGVARQLVVFLKRPGRPGAVQRRARHADRRPRRRHRRAGLDRGPPRRRPVGGRARDAAPR